MDEKQGQSESGCSSVLAEASTQGETAEQERLELRILRMRAQAVDEMRRGIGDYCATTEQVRQLEKQYVDNYGPMMFDYIDIP